MTPRPGIVHIAAGAVALMMLVPSADAANDTDRAQQSNLRPISKDSTWALRLPKDDKVIFKGVVNLDAAGTNSQSMMYPGTNAIVFLAAIATHAVVVDSMREHQKEKLQETADRVLSPYHEVLANFSHKELMQRALERTSAVGVKKVVEFTEQPGGDLFIESAPVFSMTQDERAIILDDAIAIYAPGTPSTPAYQNVIRVVSQPAEGANLIGFWTANQGEKLKDESIGLFAESIDIVLGEATRGTTKNDNPYKTVRYLQGGLEKMERGQLISELCDRVVIRNLRGWLMSVPAHPAAGTPPAADCGAPAGGAK
jgi:hypothetical protein